MHNKIPRPYQLDESISNLRDVGSKAQLHSNFKSAFCKQQCRTWSGSALFDDNPQKASRLMLVNARFNDKVLLSHREYFYEDSAFLLPNI